MRASVPGRYGVWIGLFAAAAAYYPRFVKDPTGMTLYPQAAQCLLHNELISNCALAFTYPPTFAFLMVPFVPLPMWTRNLLWYTITIAATAVVWRGCEILARRFYPDNWSERDLAFLRIGTAILGLKFILAVFENQAYDLVALALIVVGLLKFEKQTNVGAAWLALAAAIKATPLIFLPWLLIKRHYIAAGCFTGVFLFASFLPDLLFAPKGAAHGHFLTWLHEVAGSSLRNDPSHSKFAFWAGANQLNHSLRGAVARFIDEQSHRTDFTVVLYSTWLTFAAALGILILSSPSRPEYASLDGSFLLIGMLMLSPMTSRSHYVLLLLPYMMLVASAVRRSTSRQIAVSVLVVSFILCTATSNDIVGERVTGWAYLYGFMPIGAIVLMIGLGMILLQNRVDDRVQLSSQSLIAVNALFLAGCLIAVAALMFGLYFLGYLPTGD
jgi:Glycosyltransferase family 87